MAEVLRTATLTGYEPEIGRWVWALQEVRRRTLETVGGLDQVAIDWQGADGRENSIGTLLYHVALVEACWLFMDIFEQDIPEPLKSAFPHAMASEGRLTPVLGDPLAEHLRRLEIVRQALLQKLQGMTLEDWETLRDPEGVDYEVAPAWAVFHLVEHEAGHCGQICSLKTRRPGP